MCDPRGDMGSHPGSEEAENHDLSFSLSRSHQDKNMKILKAPEIFHQFDMVSDAYLIPPGETNDPLKINF